MLRHWFPVVIFDFLTCCRHICQQFDIGRVNGDEEPAAWAEAQPFAKFPAKNPSGQWLLQSGIPDIAQGSNMGQVTLKGSCLCHAVQYEVSGEPKHFYHCHCSRCRKSTGTGHATNLMMVNAKLVYTSGESRVRTFKVPDAKRFARQFCEQCGGPVPRYVPEADFVIIPAGSLDDEVPIKPQARIFWDSRADWSCDGDSLPRFAEYPG